MLKKTFLKKLESSLTPLGEEKISKIIRKYENIIDNEVSNGKLEKDVIASLGDIELISKVYLDEEKENDEKNKENAKEDVKDKSKKANSFEDGINKFANYIDSIFKNNDNDQTKKIILLAIFIALIALSVEVLKFPFKMFGHFGDNFIERFDFDSNVYRIFSVFLVVCITCCFIGLIVYFVLKFTKNEISNDKKVSNDEPTGVLNDYSVSNDENTAIKVILTVLKVFVIIITIPFVMAVAGLYICLFLLIFLAIKGITVFGLIFFILGLIILINTILDLVYNSLFKRRNK